MKKTKILKWALLLALSTWGCFSFLVLIGEVDPQSPMNLVQFMFMKFGALASLTVTVWGGERLHKAGCLPDLSKLIEEE